jgi:hypothetical protein
MGEGGFSGSRHCDATTVNTTLAIDRSLRGHPPLDARRRSPVDIASAFAMLLRMISTAPLRWIGSGLGLLWLGLTLTALPAGAADLPPARPAPVPVILDTDIGDDIDDTWALALLLKSPELDLKLVVGDYGEAPYRARLLAKLLERAGRTNVPVGIGLDIAPRGDGRQAAWVKDYNLQSYPGKVHADGVQAIIDTIMSSPQPVTLICIGPVPNIAEALKREPRIAEHARFKTDPREPSVLTAKLELNPAAIATTLLKSAGTFVWPE